jgi:hypothetical protein
MQRGENHLNGGSLFHGMLIHGNSATIVRDPDAPIGENDHVDQIAVPGEGLIHGVIDDFIDKVVEAPGAC